VKLEADCDGGADFDRRDAHFAVALCEVPVAGRKQRAFRKHRQQKL